MRLLFASAAFATACLWAPPAQADIRDVAVAAAADRAQLAVALDQAPSAAAAAPIADGFMIDLSGVELAEGVWEPYDARLVRRIEMRPREGGAALAVFTQIEVLAARARVEGRSVVVDVRLAADIGGASAASPRTAGTSAPATDAGADDDEDAEETLVAHYDAADDAAAPAPDGHAASDTTVIADNEHGAHAAEGADDHAAHAADDDDAAAGGEAAHDETHDEAGAHAADGAGDDDDAPAAGGGSFGGPAVIGPTADDAAPGAGHGGAHHDEAADEADVEAAAEEEAPEGGEAAHLLAAHLSGEDCENAEIAAREDAWDLAALSVYGACLARMGEADRATEIFERLATFTPTDPEVSLGRGALAQDAGELGAAREFYESALAHSATDAIAARSRAFLATLDD